MNPKFSVGQKVKFMNDPDTEAGEVLGFSYNPATGFVYTISAVFMDMEAKKALPGVKTLAEAEIVEVKA